MNRFQHIQGWLGKKIWFIVLLPVFFLLHMVTEYYPMLQLKHLFIPISGWFIFIPLVVYCSLRFIKPSLIKYAGFIFYLEFVFFFFASIKTFFEVYLPVVAHYKYFLTLILAAGVVFFLISLKRKTPPYRFFLYLNTLLLTLLVIECARLLADTVPPVKKAFAFNQSKNDLPTLPPCDTCLKPDVYFIILDSYTSSVQLKDYWQYDNSNLDSFLLSHGFYLAAHSKSNYNYTPFSIGSILNMDYHRITFHGKINMLQYCTGIKTIENNRVCRLFEQMGYTIFNYSFFPVPGAPPRQDVSFLTHKRELLVTPTLYFNLQKDIGWHFNKGPGQAVTDEIRQNNRLDLQQIQNAYKNLLAAASQPHPQPVFVYAHLMVPHAPFFYDSTGHIKPPSAWNNPTDEKADYLQQLIYTNSLIKNMINRLQQPANRPKVIIIQGDHGFRSYPADMNQLEFKNLNAIYCPDRQYPGLYDSISSVNTFRFILHKYFNAPLPFLKDSTVYIHHN